VRDDAPKNRPGIPFYAKTRVFTFQPEGASIVPKINIPENAHFDSVRSALKVISEVHGDGPLPSLGVTRGRVLRGQAAYEYDEATGRALRLLVADDYEELDVAHEIGHFLDQHGLGRGKYASRQLGGILTPWKQAVEESRAFRGLKSLKDRETKVIDIYEEMVERPVNQESVDYLLRSQEFFARSYAQYIASSSGNSAMRRQVGQFATNKYRQMLYNEQWEDDDFEPIAQAFDQIFKELGWLR
jgi:hypothetical protein